jgi:hypothetical protein
MSIWCVTLCVYVCHGQLPSQRLQIVTVNLCEHADLLCCSHLRAPLCLSLTQNHRGVPVPNFQTE